MARSTPRVERDTLVDPADAAQPIIVGAPAWYAWLEQATSFAFIGTSGRFTARKERRGRADGYWRAYRKHAGKVSSAYLGKSADLTLGRLQYGAAALANAAVPESQAGWQGTDPPATKPSMGGQSATACCGPVTFLFTAIDDIGTLWTQDPHAMREVHARWTAILDAAITVGGGSVFKTDVDVVSAAFASPLDAITVALAAYRTLDTESWGGIGSLHTRMVLHTGVVAERDGDYVGRPVRWGMLLLAASHGCQILLSQVTRELLRDQLPAGAALRDLGAYSLEDTSLPEHLFQLITPGMPTDCPPLRPPARRPHNLPVPPTPLIGRERDVAAVVAALHRSEVRVLTLTGPAGVGKTRLGLHVAAELRNAFADDVFFVDLATLHDPDFVVPTIAHMFGVSEVDEQPLLTRLRDYVATKHLLLLLDNFEQVLPAAAQLAALLLAAPQLKLLVTSRAALHLAGEHEFPMVPLALPKDQSLPLDQLIHYGAVALFIQRAQAVQPDFVVTDETAPLVVEICRRLDGLPLAIELAAARIKLLSPAVLLQRLERRLPLLTGGARDLPARQQTLRAAIDWSYQLLDGGAQVLLQRLAVFEGGFTLEAAETICGIAKCDDQSASSNLPSSVLDGLAALVDQSLLRPAKDSTGAPRFTMLETLREYALDRLELSEDAPALRQRHAVYYLNSAEQSEPDLRGENRRMLLDRLEVEHANLRAVLRWALAQGAAELAARLASALGVFWDVRHRREGRAWLEATLASGTLLPPAIRAKALHAAGWLARAQYDQAAAIAWFEESLGLYREVGDERGRTDAMTELGWTLATIGGDMTRATAHLEEGLAWYRALGDPRGIARALQGLGWVEQHRALGDRRGIPWSLSGLSWVARNPEHLAGARTLHEESLALHRAAADAPGVAWSLSSLSLIAAAQGEYDAARACEEERLAIERSLDNRHGIAAALQKLGLLAFRQGDAAAARRYLTKSLMLAREIADKGYVAFSLRGLGEIAQVEGDTTRATVLLDEALAHFRELGDTHRMARVYGLLAQVALDAQDEAKARSTAMQSLQLARSVDDPATIISCLVGLADSAVRQGQASWAAQLWGAAGRERDAMQAQRVPVESAHHPQLVEAGRTALGAQTFAAAWAAGRALTPEEALAAPDMVGPALAPAGTDVSSQRPAPASPRPAGLTPRELEVLLLVVEGLSNAKIAERLVIGAGTVKAYLSAIYRKLGVASRTAAMRYVIDHRLQ